MVSFSQKTPQHQFLQKTSCNVDVSDRRTMFHCLQYMSSGPDNSTVFLHRLHFLDAAGDCAKWQLISTAHRVPIFTMVIWWYSMQFLLRPYSRVTVVTWIFDQSYFISVPTFYWVWYRYQTLNLQTVYFYQIHINWLVKILKIFAL